MSAGRGSYLGPRLRRLRRDLGLSQPGMAADLGVSVSYISLLENNQRPLSADMFLRVARTYAIDIARFAGDGGAEFASRLKTTLSDPLFTDIDLPPLHVADVASNYPGFAEALLRVYGAYREEHRALTEQTSGEAPPEATPSSQLAEVRHFLSRHRNCFPEIEVEAETLSLRIEGNGGFEEHLASAHGLRVRRMPPRVMAGLIRRHDPHHAAVFLDDTLDEKARRFQLALQIAYLSLGNRLVRIIEESGLSSKNAKRLGRRALANYAAAALLMPYRRFAAAVDEGRYDIELLCGRFDVSFEQVAHRMATLQKPGEERVSFFLVQLDAGGNVSKRLDGAGFPLSQRGGSCPLWSVHEAPRVPGRIVTQWLELPEGQRFFSIARTASRGGGFFAATRFERTVALVCSSDDARQLIYADALPDADATPIGVTCELCQRELCPARAVPPIGRQILSDDYHRGIAPFRFADH